MSFYQCFVYDGIAVAIEEHQTSQGGAVGEATFETGDITPLVKPFKQRLWLYEYNGTLIDGSTDGSIIPCTSENAVNSYANRASRATTSIIEVSATTYTVGAEQHNHWFYYDGVGVAAFSLPSLSDVPEDFEFTITNHSANKSRIVVTANTTDPIVGVAVSKILTYGSWVRFKVYEMRWVILNESNQIQHDGSGTSPVDEIIFEENLIIDVNEDGGIFNYIGIAAATVTVPDLNIISNPWEVQVMNNSQLGSVIALYAHDGSQTVGASQVYHLTHGIGITISYSGSGLAYTVAVTGSGAFNTEMKQAVEGDVLTFVSLPDGNKGWTPRGAESGITASRPLDAVVGQMFFDTSLNAANGMPIWYNGTTWVDYSGASV